MIYIKQPRYFKYCGILCMIAVGGAIFAPPAVVFALLNECQVTEGFHAASVQKICYLIRQQKLYK